MQCSARETWLQHARRDARLKGGALHSDCFPIRRGALAGREQANARDKNPLIHFCLGCVRQSAALLRVNGTFTYL